jgi:hypothetical protein
MADKPLLFGESLGSGEQPLPELLADVQRNLRGLAEQYGDAPAAGERFEILDEALDELDGALERVRDARVMLARIEVRLATAYERAVARMREADREADSA